MKRIMVLGAGFYHRRIYEFLSRGPYYCIGVDRDPAAPAASLAHEFYPVDIANEKEIVNLARAVGVDAVMPLNEFGMRSHAAAVEQLGLLGNPPKSAEWVVDKEQMRSRWAQCNLPQPLFAAFGEAGRDTDMDDIRKAADHVGFPCVIKPADSGGSGRGVMILRTEDELVEGEAFASPFARNGRMILESYLEGIEITVEGLVVNGRYTTLAASDKEKPPLRSRVATSLNYPAFFDISIMRHVDEIIEKAVACFDLTHSAVHAELIITPENEPMLVELGARGGGGHVFSDLARLVSGVDMPCALAAILCGEQPDLSVLKRSGACYRFFNPPQGRLREVRGLKEAAKLEGVVDIGMFKRPGEKVGSLPNSLSRAGFVVTCGKDREEAWETANQVERIVRLVVDEDDDHK